MPLQEILYSNSEAQSRAGTFGSTIKSGIHQLAEQFITMESDEG